MTMLTRSSDRLGGSIVTRIAIVALLAVTASFGQAAAQATPEAAGPVQIVSPAAGAEVTGRDVVIAWEAPGQTIVPAAEAANETDYHAHFIVDGAYEVIEGAPIPQQCGVLHTASNPATLTNLAPGEHTVELVIANPGHVPVAGLERPAVTFTVAEDAEAIRITSPENCEEVAGPDVMVAWEAPGLTIVPAADAQNETDLHAHFIVDNAYEVAEGAPIPVQAGVVHTAANPAAIEGLTPGPHTVQLVIGNPGHIPVADLARPRVTFIVAEGATPEAGAATPAAAAPQAVAGAALEMYDIYFEPKEITVPADTGVTLTITNKGVTLHNFAIDALDVSVDVDPGATEEVVIDAPAGEYEFYCNVPGHKAAGMVGTLIVE
jgi:uncharacterized cupredoxin-like copper-binding protein